MTNQRDSGRYNQFTGQTTDDNVRVDFAWGNIPMQPNDDRGMAQLDPALDSHIIAAVQYEGFPAFTPGYPFDDTIPNIEVPNLVGLVDPETAQAALENAGLVLGDTNSSTAGATSGNDLHVKSQTPAAGTLVNEGAAVDIVVYDYVVPANPIAGLSTTNLPSGWSAMAGGEIVMYLLGRTTKPTVGDVISISGNTNTSLNQNYNVNIVENDDHYNTGGTAVKLTAITNALANPNTNSGGTWVKIA